MATPRQGELHLPILDVFAEASREDTLTHRQISGKLILNLSLDDDEISKDRLPSGGTRFDKNVRWAVYQLKDRGFLAVRGRGKHQITDEGREFLANRATGSTQSQMNEGMPELQSDNDTISLSESVNSMLPDESLEEAYKQLQAQLIDEMLDSLKSVSPDRFERLVVELLEKMGYGEGRQVGGSGDGGIDGIINQDPLGLEKVYIQAKRYETAQVGEPPIRNFAGSLVAQGASKGVFITTSVFSSTAKQTAQNVSAGNQFIRLIDGQELARLMINHNVGVVPETTYVIKKLDENYFADEI